MRHVAGQSSSRVRLAIDAGTAVIATVAAVVLRLSIDPVVSGVQFITFFPAVILVAYVRGSKASLLTALMCGVAGWYLFLEPQYSFEITRPAEVISLATYLVVSSVMAVSVSGLRAALVRERRHRERQQILVDELNHRVKNNLSIVQAIARQTLKPDVCHPRVRAEFDGRLIALSSAHEVLTRRSWEEVKLTDLITNLLGAIGVENTRVRTSGPDIALKPKPAITLTLAIHELATNALKYGALSVDCGSVRIEWTTEDQHLRFEWREEGGPIVHLPQKRGFGTSMVERALAREFGGKVELRFPPAGVVCIIRAPLTDGEALLGE
jgi:two-component sensor histidine kinase